MEKLKNRLKDLLAFEFPVGFAEAIVKAASDFNITFVHNFNVNVH